MHAHVSRQILEANSTLERLAQEITELREINDQVRVALETTRKQASDFQQYVNLRDRTTPLPSPLGRLWRPHAVLSEAQIVKHCGNSDEWVAGCWMASTWAHRSPHASIAQATMHVWCPFFRLERRVESCSTGRGCAYCDAQASHSGLPGPHCVHR